MEMEVKVACNNKAPIHEIILRIYIVMECGDFGCFVEKFVQFTIKQTLIMCEAVKNCRSNKVTQSSKVLTSVMPQFTNRQKI